MIPPNIWRNDELDNEYWKNDTYHPSLKDKDVHTMETDAILIGKVMKGKKKHATKKENKKKFHEIMFETLLMCDSNKLQVNEFSEKQCRDMLIQNRSLDQSEDIFTSIEKIDDMETLKESGSSTGNNVDDTSAFEMQENQENRQDCQDLPKKRHHSSKFRKMPSEKNIPINENEMMQIDEVINQDCQETKNEIQVAPKKRKISPKKKACEN